MSGLMVGLLCRSFSTSTSAQDAASFNLLNLAGNNVHWQAPADGQALIVTYMLVRDDVELPQLSENDSIEHLISESELAPATVHEEIAAAFLMWEAQ